MNCIVYNVLIYFWLQLFLQRSATATNERFPTAKGFLRYRAVSTFHRYCSCSTSYSCSCCQNVFILYTKAEKNLCVNFTYQRNGLNVDVTLNSDTVKARTVSDYKPFKFCTPIPGCYFSSACVNVLELNKFPRSVTVCLRLDIFSKKRVWQLNYDCVSISTELPMIPSNATTPMTMNTTEATASTSAMSTMTTAEMTSTMASSQMMMTTLMMATKIEAETEETTIPVDVEVLTPSEVMDID